MNRVQKQIWLYIDPESYEAQDVILFGLEHRDDDLSLASIKDLRLDAARQIRLLELGMHADGELIPWGNQHEMIRVQEGKFVWDDNMQNYTEAE